MKINGFAIDGFEGFAYDGCHKIYLYKHYDAKEFRDLGYTLYPFDIEFKNDANGMPTVIKRSNELIECYLNSCLLRFIYAYDSMAGQEYKTIVPQFAERIEFEGFKEYEDDEISAYWENDKFIVEMK